MTRAPPAAEAKLGELLDQRAETWLPAEGTAVAPATGCWAARVVAMRWITLPGPLCGACNYADDLAVATGALCPRLPGAFGHCHYAFPPCLAMPGGLVSRSGSACRDPVRRGPGIPRHSALNCFASN